MRRGKFLVEKALENLKNGVVNAAESFSQQVPTRRVSSRQNLFFNEDHYSKNEDPGDGEGNFYVGPTIPTTPTKIVSTYHDSINEACDEENIILDISNSTPKKIAHDQTFTCGIGIIGPNQLAPGRVCPELALFDESRLIQHEVSSVHCANSCSDDFGYRPSSFIPFSSSSHEEHYFNLVARGEPDPNQLVSSGPELGFDESRLTLLEAPIVQHHSTISGCEYFGPSTSSFIPPSISCEGAFAESVPTVAFHTAEDSLPTPSCSFSTALPPTNSSILISCSVPQLEKVLARKRAADPNSWKVNVNKKLRKECLPYCSKKGWVTRPAKSPQEATCSRCDCPSKFSQEERVEICKAFHKMDFMRQKDFILKCVILVEIERKRAKKDSQKEKTCSRKYSLPNSDEVSEIVCKSFFLKTLCISHGPVDKALEGENSIQVYGGPDRRGKHEPKNKTLPERIERIKNHIESFPVMESHYCRKDTRRKYLDPNLSIAKMYELYKTECERDNQPFTSDKVYRTVFCEQYNLSFFVPRKDQCGTCNAYKSASKEKQVELKEQYELHLQRKADGKKAKKLDKLRANSDKSFVTTTFDLQSVLQIPSSDVSQLYYSRKINAYNLTVYEDQTRSFCFCWTEMNGLRGSSEIGSALIKWFETLPEEVSELSLFSDCCGGQNRNQHVASMFLYIVNTHPSLKSIEHKFLESGHTQMEADSMHSAIESAKANVPVYSVQDWMMIMRMARSARNNAKCKPYHVRELKFSDMVDLKKLSAILMTNRVKDNEGGKVSWLRIKRLKFIKGSNTILFSYNYFGNYSELDPSGGQRGIIYPDSLERLHKGYLPISQAKKKDLLKLCKTPGCIPPEYHNWFKNIKTCRTAVDRAPGPSQESEEEEF